MSRISIAQAYQQPQTPAAYYEIGVIGFLFGLHAFILGAFWLRAFFVDSSATPKRIRYWL